MGSGAGRCRPDSHFSPCESADYNAMAACRKVQRPEKFSWIFSSARIADLREQPGAGVSPVAFRRAARNPQEVGRLLDGQASEVAELDKLGFSRLQGRQAAERFVEGQEVVARTFGENQCLVQVNSAAPPAVAEAVFLARVLDQDAPNGLRGGSEEMAAIVPSLRLPLGDWRLLAIWRWVADQTQVR